MAVTLFLVDKDGDHVLKYGLCRYLEDSEVQSIVNYFISEAKLYAPCTIIFHDKYCNVKNPPQVLHYDSSEEGADQKLSEFFNAQKYNIGNWNVWRGLTIKKDGVEDGHEYEFDDINV